ncbi:Rne/Rng family ribonuclease [Psychrobacter sp. HD31]|uniref:Rne/Rng family ribonuclease n=1 Tax=Psychrobacter sp. HD31 TaxID=3112003 RepID=UPI003DA45137
MSEELLINVSPMESRVAIMNDGVLSEIYIERHNKMGLVGNIYLGTVVRVLPGMQAAFIDIGQSRTAFLHVNDMQKINRPAMNELSTIQQSNKPAPAIELSTPQVPLSDTQTNDNGLGQIKSIKQAFVNQQTNAFSQTAKPTEAKPTDISSTDKTLEEEVQDNDLSVQPNNLENGVAEASQPINLVNPNNLTIVDKPIRSLATVRESLTPEDKKPKPVRQPEPTPSHELIQNRLHEGQRILVQVTKDQLGTKGARLTTNISLPSRYLVYLPSSDHIGISQRIENEEERTRLKTELSEIMQAVDLSGGLIARTAAEHIQKNKLEEDIYYLVQLWRTIQARQKEANASQLSVLIYQELSLPLRAIRDLVHEQTERVVIDDAYMYDYLRQFAKEFVPMIYPRIVPHTSELALFDIHRVEEDLKDALKRRVDLKSGGYLIIDQTEAMTTIDVNTGSYVGGRSLEDTVYKTNLEATYSIARQLRLRNLGGIIILDFIDMQEQEHRDDVLSSLQMQLAQDYAKTNITQVSELGLVEMTRKRTRESLEQQLCEPCPTCEGKGFIKTAETVCFEIFREIVRCARTYNAPKQFTVVAHASVIDLLLTTEADTVADLEYLVGRVITFEVERLYTQEQYDIVLD